jgi:diacylglycerol kinase (ATP)
LLRSFPGMMTGKLPLWHEQLRVGRCRSLSVVAERPLCIHADGELFAIPPDGLLEAQFELLPAALKVETYAPGLYGSGKYAALDSRYRE